MYITRRIAASIALVGSLLAVTACSGPPRNEAGNALNGALRIGVAAIPTTLDPVLNTNTNSFAIIRLVTGTLTDPAEDGTTVMGLAESVKPTGEKAYVIKLKPDLKFSDGSAVTSTDVVASYEYYMADKLNTDRVWHGIQRISASDDLTINVDLTQPDSDFAGELSSPRAAILPSQAIKAKGENLYKGDLLPTAGPFQVDSLDKNQITLHANPHYAGSHPATTTLQFKLITDPASRLAQIRAGQLDFASGISSKQAKQLADPVEVRTTEHANGATYLGMNNRDNSLLSDVRIRKAIAVAIDRDQINQVAYAGLNQPLLTLSSASPLTDPVSYLSEHPNMEQAKTLLAGTKCEHGCTLTFITYDDQPTLDAATVIQQNLKKIGIEVHLQMTDVATLLQRRQHGDYDLAIASMWSTMPGYYVDFALGKSNNALSSGYSSPEMYGLIQKAFTTSGPERDAAYDDINTLYSKDMPYPPIARLIWVSASRVPSKTFDMAPSFFFHVG